MSKPDDVKKIYSVDRQWYQKIWTLDIQNMSWVEQTKQQADFIYAALQLGGRERVLDLACGFGRHALELARRGCEVVGVDITADFINEARKQAKAQGVNAEFICADLRAINFRNEFDVVLNLADGAIGYLESDPENLKIFDVISLALKRSGKHLMDICNGAYAAKHFPKRHWEVGQHALSLADFEWDSQSSRMFYGGLDFKYGEILTKPVEIFCNPTRLYNLQELELIFQSREMVIRQAFGEYDLNTPASDDYLQLVVYSQKL